MRLIIFIFSLLIISCSSNGRKVGINEQTGNKSEIIIHTDKELLKTELTFEKVQDSLRNELLNLKSNENLKSSILEELYIRGLVNQVDSLIKFRLPFDLHGFDCGAPDCYSTDITFAIQAKEPVEFPKIIDFHLFEHGCVDKEINTDGIFELVELSYDYVNYYSKTHRSNLVIIKEEGLLYYFPDTKPNSVKVSLIDEIFKNYDEEDSYTIAPYQSTIMTTNEYENFIKNK